MLAKKIPNRWSAQSILSSFQARAKYSCAKAVMVVTGNLAGDWQDAPFQMDVAARLTPRLRSPVYHIVLTWAPDEKPKYAEMIDAGLSAIYELGGHVHQYVLAIHIDHAGLHLHILLNRAHPLGGPSLSTSHDYALLEKACRRMEHQMGWPQDRGRFDAQFIDGDVHLVPKPTQHWARKTADRKAGIRPDSLSVRGTEHRTGLPVLRDAYEPETLNAIRSSLDMSPTWAAVHTALEGHGLRYILYRSGAQIARLASNLAMAACHLGSDYGLGAMQRRLGPFVALAPTEDRAIKIETTATQIQPLTALLSWFAQPLKLIKKTHSLQKDLRTAHKAEWQSLKTQQKQEVAQFRQAFDGDSSAFARAALGILREKHRAETRQWKAQNPTPDRISQDKTPILDQMMPTVMLLRRYRHVLRTRPLGVPPPTDPQPYLDHTDVRQMWALSPYQSSGANSETIKKIGNQFPFDARIDESGRVLLAQRNRAGSIVGFDVLDLPSLTPSKPAHTSFGEGLYLLGPRDAQTVVIVLDASAAIAQSISSHDPHPLILAIGENITPEVKDILEAFAENHDCVIAIPQTAERAQLYATLAGLIPKATYCDPAIVNIRAETADPSVSKATMEINTADLFQMK